MQTSDWISLGGVLVALLALAWSIRSDRKATSAGSAADEARERSADALAKAADALSRSSAADERSADALTAVRDELAKLRPVARVAWSIKRHSGEGFLLTNTGTADATSVSIDIGTRQPGNDQDRKYAVLRSGDAELFTAGAFSGSTNDITVTWVNPDGTNGIWTHVLPPGGPGNLW